MGQVHQLITVHHCAVLIFARTAGSGSLLVAAERPTRSVYTIQRKKHMLRAQDVHRAERFPCTTSSPLYPEMIIRADPTPRVWHLLLDSSAGRFITSTISMSRSGTVRSQSMYR